MNLSVIKLKVKKPTHLLLTIIILITFNTFSNAQTARWLRYASISPDGSSIVFNYKGDIYKVGTNGGYAQALTANAAYDHRAIWSNNGQNIAFASNRYGNFDIFIINKDGGIPKRLTYHSGDDIPFSFTSDNKNVLFSASRFDKIGCMLFPTSRQPELYSVDTLANRPKQIFSIPVWNAQYSDNNKYLIFEDIKGGEDPFRKHHTSSVTRDLWKYDTELKEFKMISDNKGEDRNPVFTSNNETYYFLSERNGSFNVYKSSINNTETKQISNFKMHPVRYLSISDDGLLCYSFNGDIYTQKEGENPQKLEIKIIRDQLNTEEKILNVKQISEMKLSPNGKEFGFVYRGEVFVGSIDGSLVKRITNTPEQERSINFSPDGKSIIYAGERLNSWNIYKSKLVNEKEKYFINATLLKEETVLANAEETFQPAYSPDGKEIAFISDRTKLKVINLETKEIRTILDGSKNYSYSDGDQYYEWSPDGKWFLVEFFPDKYWFNEIGLIKTDGSGKIINLSKSGFSDVMPKWTKKNNMIIWASNKHGMKSVANTGASEMDIYALFLTKKAYQEYLMSKDEFKIYEDLNEKENKKEKDDDKKSKKDKKKQGAEKDKIKPIKIEFEGLLDRKVKLSLHSSRLSDAVISGDGKYLVYFCKVDKDYDLWRTELRTKETKIIANYGKRSGSIELDKKGKHVFVLNGGKITKVEIESGKKESVSVSGELILRESEERAYIFDHVARQVKKRFYDKKLHGTDWDSLTANYRQFLPYITNNYDFRDLLSELLGELNASHTGSRYYPSHPNGDKTASLGLLYDTEYTGKGLKIMEILPKNTIIPADSKIKKGIILEKINGKNIEKNINYYPLLNRQTGKRVLLSLFDPDKNKRWEERIKPMSLRQENQLLYIRWIRRNRELVHKLSNNKVGYVHIRGMNDGSYRNALEEIMGEEVNKQALIVDTRFNGGGDLVDDLCTFLSGKKYMEFKGDGRTIGFESQRRWTKPSIVIAGEGNYSDAHCFPAAYKDLGIGKIVGMPVPGTCTFVWWEFLQNGMIFGIPNMGVTDKSGDILENKQLEPDILIKNEYDKVINNQDQQIEAAVNELLKQLK